MHFRKLWCSEMSRAADASFLFSSLERNRAGRLEETKSQTEKDRNTEEKEKRRV